MKLQDVFELAHLSFPQAVLFCTQQGKPLDLQAETAVSGGCSAIVALRIEKVLWVAPEGSRHRCVRYGHSVFRLKVSYELSHLLCVTAHRVRSVVSCFSVSRALGFC